MGGALHSLVSSMATSCFLAELFRLLFRPRCNLSEMLVRSPSDLLPSFFRQGVVDRNQSMHSFGSPTLKCM
jgi:hypothetical protein